MRAREETGLRRPSLIIAAAWPTIHATPGLAESYDETLGDLDPAAVRAAVSSLAGAGAGPPPPARLRTVILARERAAAPTARPAAPAAVTPAPRARIPRPPVRASAGGRWHLMLAVPLLMASLGILVADGQVLDTWAHQRFMGQVRDLKGVDLAGGPLVGAMGLLGFVGIAVGGFYLWKRRGRRHLLGIFGALTAAAAVQIVACMLALRDVNEGRSITERQIQALGFDPVRDIPTLASVQTTDRMTYSFAAATVALIAGAVGFALVYRANRTDVAPVPVPPPARPAAIGPGR